MVGLPNQFTTYSFRVGGWVSKSLAGTAVDEFVKIRGWKTESISTHYIGSATSAGVRASDKTRDHGYASTNEVPLSMEFESDFSMCAKSYA